MIQVAASFLSLPDAGGNSLISIALGIGLFATLLKTPGIFLQLITSHASMGIIKKVGGQMMNVISTSKTGNTHNGESPSHHRVKKASRDMRYS